MNTIPRTKHAGKYATTRRSLLLSTCFWTYCSACSGCVSTCAFKEDLLLGEWRLGIRSEFGGTTVAESMHTRGGGYTSIDVDNKIFMNSLQFSVLGETQDSSSADQSKWQGLSKTDCMHQAHRSSSLKKSHAYSWKTDASRPPPYGLGRFARESEKPEGKKSEGRRLAED